MNKVDQNLPTKANTDSGASSLDGTSALAEARLTITRTRAELEASIASLEEEASRLQALIELHLKEINSLKQMRQAIIGLATHKEEARPKMRFAPRKRERTRSRAWIVRQNAREILLAKGHPLSSAELLPELADQGVSIEKRQGQAAKTISKILWAAAEFTSTPRGYWLTDVPLPPTTDEAGKRKRTTRTANHKRDPN